MKKKTTQEIPLYDWIPGREGKALIYVGRKPSKDDPGITRRGVGPPTDALFTLYKKNLLTGKALLAAQELWQDKV